VNLRELLEEEATNLPGAEPSLAPDGSITWSRGGRPIAIVNADGSSAEFALDPAVADAAARTPDVSASDRGPGWVVFGPSDLDDHAADRAVAWLASAHRRAEPRN
jgi:transcription elongation factor